MPHSPRHFNTLHRASCTQFFTRHRDCGAYSFTSQTRKLRQEDVKSLKPPVDNHPCQPALSSIWQGRHLTGFTLLVSGARLTDGSGPGSAVLFVIQSHLPSLGLRVPKASQVRHQQFSASGRHNTLNLCTPRLTGLRDAPLLTFSPAPSPGPAPTPGLQALSV